jgi:hypothetical protein
MQKNRLMLTLLVVALFTSYAGPIALASLSPGIYTDPGTISVPGLSTTITLVTPLKATGTLTITDPNGNRYTAAISTTKMGPSDWEQSWVFPDNFTSQGANTDTTGTYDVTANITMTIGRYVWKTMFEVVFFVVPDLPFGTLMAVVACFGAFLGYKKTKTITGK